MVSQLSNSPSAYSTDLVKRQPNERKNKPQQPKAPWILLVIVFGLIVVGLIRAGATSKQSEEGITVVAAAKDIAPGYRLNFQDLHYTSLPKRYAKSTFVRSYAEIVGSISNTFVPKGQPFNSTNIVAKDLSFATTVGVAGRAFTLKLPAENAVDRMIAPGDRVDIITTTLSPNGQRYTKTIIQNVMVLMAIPKELSASDRLRSDSDKLTLQLTPVDAEKLAQAIEDSKIRLVLRNPHSTIAQQLPGADSRDLLPHDALRREPPAAVLPAPSIAPPPLPVSMSNPIEMLPKEAAAPIQWVVDVFKGSTKESQTFAQP